MQADEAASGPGNELDDLLSRLGGDMDGVESEDKLKGILETMMSQLMSKDVLYEPLKELHEKVGLLIPAMYRQLLTACPVPLVPQG